MTSKFNTWCQHVVQYQHLRKRTLVLYFFKSFKCACAATQWLYVWTQPLSGSMSEHSHSVALCLKLYLVLYVMYANRKGTGDTAWMHRLAWAFAGRLSLRQSPEPSLVAYVISTLSHKLASFFSGSFKSCPSINGDNYQKTIKSDRKNASVRTIVYSHIFSHI